jgi:hypothetical protein
VSTIHAETAELVIDRLAIMVLKTGTPLTFAEVWEYIRKSIDVIVQLGRVDGKQGLRSSICQHGRWPHLQKSFIGAALFNVEVMLDSLVLISVLPSIIIS